MASPPLEGVAVLCQRSARGAAVSLNREFIRICNHVSSAESTAASRIGIAYTARASEGFGILTHS